MEITAYHYNNAVTKKEIKTIYKLIDKNLIKYPHDLSIGSFITIINYKGLNHTTLNIRGVKLYDYIADNYVTIDTFEELVSLILKHF